MQQTLLQSGQTRGSVALDKGAQLFHVRIQVRGEFPEFCKAVVMDPKYRIDGCFSCFAEGRRRSSSQAKRLAVKPHLPADAVIASSALPMFRDEGVFSYFAGDCCFGVMSAQDPCLRGKEGKPLQRT